MNRDFVIRVKGFAEKAEPALERMVAYFVGELPSRLSMESAEIVIEEPKPEPKPAPKPKAKPKAAAPKKKPAKAVAKKPAAKKATKKKAK